MVVPPSVNPFSVGGAERFGGNQGDRGSGPDLPFLESRKDDRSHRRRKARQRGGTAKKRGIVARAGAGTHGGRPETGSHGPPAAAAEGLLLRRSRLTSDHGGRRRTALPISDAIASYRRLASGYARGEPPIAHNRSMSSGTGSGRSAPRPALDPPSLLHSRSKDWARGVYHAAASPPAIWTGLSRAEFRLVGLATAANDPPRCLSARRDEVPPTIHQLQNLLFWTYSSSLRSMPGAMCISGISLR